MVKLACLSEAQSSVMVSGPLTMVSFVEPGVHLMTTYLSSLKKNALLESTGSG